MKPNVKCGANKLSVFRFFYDEIDKTLRPMMVELGAIWFRHISTKRVGTNFIASAAK